MLDTNGLALFMDVKMFFKKPKPVACAVCGKDPIALSIRPGDVPVQARGHRVANPPHENLRTVRHREMICPLLRLIDLPC
jgi:hypothetical protein